MQRFLLKLIIFLAGLWLLLLGLGRLADRIAPINVWRDSQHRIFAGLMERKQAIQAITIGNSHSDSINFEVLGLTGQSLARVSADLFEGERYIDSIVDELGALQTVFIPLSYYSFSIDNATQARTRMLRIDLYSMLPTWVPIAGDSTNLILGKVHRFTNVMDVARPDHWQEVITRLPRLRDLEDPTLTEADTCSPLTQAEIETHVEAVAYRNQVAAYEMASAHPHLVEDALAAAGKTIERLQAKGIAVILFTPPYYDSYNEHFATHAAGLLDEMQTAVRQLQDRYQVAYYDFSHDPAIVNRRELFLNSDHLNACGSQLFTERLLAAMTA